MITPYNIFFRKVVRLDNGTWDYSAPKVNLWQHYGPTNKDKGYQAQLYYLKATGLDSYGKPRPYTEKWAEVDGASVYIPKDTKGITPREQTEISIEFAIAVPEGLTLAEEQAKAEINRLYYDFVDDHLDQFVLYNDNVRGRKVLMYNSDAITPQLVVSGTPYLTFTVKFSNVFGRSFAASELSPIEASLMSNSNLTADDQE